jgi:hypothetical protein
MKIRSIIAVSALAAGILAGTSACDTGPACVSGHYDYVPMPIYNGKTTIITVMPVWQCDVYATPSEKSK